MEYHRVYFQDPAPFGAGERAVFAKPGRKWVKLVYWAGLETARIRRSQWDALLATKRNRRLTTTTPPLNLRSAKRIRRWMRWRKTLRPLRPEFTTLEQAAYDACGAVH